MAGLDYGVSVNPSSSQYIAPSIGDQSFFFGGNPNLAALTGNKMLLYAVVAVVALYVVMRFRR